MIITYEDRSGLYVNVTNRCSNSCDFCVRSYGDRLYGNLWLDREPTADEIREDIKKRDLSRYSELVFCGYGEPTERIEEIAPIAREVKKRSPIPIRINTNGHSSLIAGYDTAPLFKDAFDTVSISLNCADAESYVKICHPKFGEQGFYGLIDFAEKVKNYVPHVVLSVVEKTISDEDIEKCRRIAEKTGVELRVREFIENLG